MCIFPVQVPKLAACISEEELMQGVVREENAGMVLDHPGRPYGALVSNSGHWEGAAEFVMQFQCRYPQNKKCPCRFFLRKPAQNERYKKGIRTLDLL
jgi:hypothetical protein